MYFIIAFIILTLTPDKISADCLGCVKEHTEYFENGAKQQCYIKKCLAKQKDIDDAVCSGCNCAREQHSVHRHPYKWHNGKKLAEHIIDLGNTKKTDSARKEILNDKKILLPTPSLNFGTFYCIRH